MPKEKNKIPQVSNVESLELTEDIIRTRAYELFEQRGCENGHDLDDWLQAEAELIAKKPTARADQNTTLHKVAAA